MHNTFTFFSFLKQIIKFLYIIYTCMILSMILIH